MAYSYKKVMFIKSDIIGETVTVTVDRPLGSHHPVLKELYYPVNYGYVKEVMVPDGEEHDAYVFLGWTRLLRCLRERLWLSSVGKMM